MRRKTTPRVKDGKVQRKNPRDVIKPFPGKLEIRADVPRLGYRHFLEVADLERFVGMLPEWRELSRGLQEIRLVDREEDCDGWYSEGSIAICAWPDSVQCELTPRYFFEHRALFERLGVESVPQNGALLLEHHLAEPNDEVREALEDLLEADRLVFREVEPTERWLGVEGDAVLCEIERVDDGIVCYERLFLVKFVPRTVRAFQLLHVFLHELGHHLDAMSSPAKGYVVRGESYAEAWAIRHEATVWDAWMNTGR